MKLWFRRLFSWRKAEPLPEWAAQLSPEQRAVLAENLRAIVDPKSAIENETGGRTTINRRLARPQLERSAPLT